MEEKDLPAIAYRVTEELFKEEFIREEDKGKIIRALLLRHRHVNEPQDRGFRFPKKQSYTSLQVRGSRPLFCHHKIRYYYYYYYTDLRKDLSDGYHGKVQMQTVGPLA